MESNKSKCPECGAVYTWSGYKTGIGKPPHILLEMSRDDHTCKYCKSKTLHTGLNWDGSVYYKAETDVANYDPSILTDFEKKWSAEKYSDISTSEYSCKHCQGHNFTTIFKWEDTDGEFILLYCMDCKKRFAVQIGGNGS
jgi:uncharacterized Zn-finger protein